MGAGEHADGRTSFQVGRVLLDPHRDHIALTALSPGVTPEPLADDRRQLGHRYGGADTLARLAESHHADSEPEAARAAWHPALEIFTDLGHPDADSVHARLRDLE